MKPGPLPRDCLVREVLQPGLAGLRVELDVFRSLALFLQRRIIHNSGFRKGQTHFASPELFGSGSRGAIRRCSIVLSSPSQKAAGSLVSPIPSKTRKA